MLLSPVFLLAGVLAFLMAFRKRTSGLFLAFGFVSFGAGFHTLYYSNVKQFVLDAPYLWNFVWIVSTAMMIIGVLRFLELTFADRFRPVLRWAWFVHFMYAATTFTAFLIPLWSIASFLSSIRLVLYAGELLIVIPVVLRVILKRHPDSRILAAGIAVLALFMTSDLLSALRIVATYVFGTHWGLFALICSIGLIVTTRTARAWRIAARYYEDLEKARSREREFIYADIHDHIGGNLNDISIMLRNAAELITSEAAPRQLAGVLETADEQMTRSITMLRERLTAADDLKLLANDPLYGLHLMLLRRYTAAGRRLVFRADRQLGDRIRKPEYRNLSSLLHILAEEIATNDLKYGSELSRWRIESTGRRGDEKLVLSMTARTA